MSVFSAAKIAIVNLQRPGKSRGNTDCEARWTMRICRLSLLSQAQRLVRYSQERAQRFAQAMTRREHLYREFIEEASKLFTDALTHQLEEPSKFVRLYALVGNLRLCASANVIVKAQEVMRQIVETYNLPNMDFRNLEDKQEYETDVLRAFSEACREDLHVLDDEPIGQVFQTGQLFGGRSPWLWESIRTGGNCATPHSKQKIPTNCWRSCRS